jgi:serine/threonine protein phosphatase PrpC
VPAAAFSLQTQRGSRESMLRKLIEMFWRNLQRRKRVSPRKNVQSKMAGPSPLLYDDTPPPPETQRIVVPLEGLCANTRDESTVNALRPTNIEKEKPRPFEPRYVDTTKYITPNVVPDTILDGWENDFLTLRGASVRGGSHRWERIPRQDSFAAAFIPDKDWVVVAVADGVSGAPQSHVGASVAVNAAIDYFISTKTAEIERVDWKHVCEAIARHLNWAVTSLRGHGGIPDTMSEAENDITAAALKYLATTFVCAVVTKNQGGQGLAARVITVGDSGVWLLSDGRFQAVAGGKDDSSGITANDVTPLPCLPENITPTKITIKAGEVLLLGTDGFGEPLGSGDGDLGLSFKTMLKTVPSLTAFAETLDFTRKYFVDDRTLVAIWPREFAHDK